LLYRYFYSQLYFQSSAFDLARTALYSSKHVVACNCSGTQLVPSSILLLTTRSVVRLRSQKLCANETRDSKNQKQVVKEVATVEYCYFSVPLFSFLCDAEYVTSISGLV